MQKDQTPMFAPMFSMPDRPNLLPLGKHDAAFAVRQALGMRRHGSSQGVVDAAMQSEIADLIADALADAGYVVAIRQRRRAAARPAAGVEAC